MKVMRLLILALSLMLVSGCTDFLDRGHSKKKQVSILLIGSSHGMNTIAHVPQILRDAPVEPVIGNMYQGSLTLDQVAGYISDQTPVAAWFKVFEEGKWNNIEGFNISDILKYRKWDYIIVQRAAHEDETWNEEQQKSFSVILEHISSVCGYPHVVLFNSGFAFPSMKRQVAEQREETEEHTRTILASADSMRAQFNIDYIPVASSIQNARNTFLTGFGSFELHQLASDDQHLDYGIGSYVASYTVCEFILRREGYHDLTLWNYATIPEMNTFFTSVSAGNYSGMTVDNLEMARKCAADAVNGHERPTTE